MCGIAPGVPAASTSVPPARSLIRALRAGGAERGRLPQPGGDADRGRLAGVELDRRQLVVAAGDPVAVVGVEGAVATGFERYAEIAQFGLVAFEHALERLVGPLGAVGRPRSRAPPGGSARR